MDTKSHEINRQNRAEIRRRGITTKYKRRDDDDPSSRSETRLAAGKMLSRVIRVQLDTYSDIIKFFLI